MLLARPAGRHRRTSRSAMSAGRRRRRAAQALPNKRVLVVAHENITNNYYAGNNRSCLVSNCLFRVGGAACMLSNRCAPPRPRAGARRAGSATASLVHAGFLCCCCISSGARELAWWWCDRYRTCAACLRARISSWGVPGSAGAWH